MKKLSIIIVLTLAGFALKAQQFSSVSVKALDENMTSIQATWVSIDADTLFDFVVTGVVNNQLKIVLYDNQLVKKNTLLTGMRSGYVQIADWDRDNKMDILISGKTAINTDALFLFKSNGDFTYTKLADKLLEYSGKFRVADMNNDALPDIVPFGAATDLSVFDMNNDGKNDTVPSPDNGLLSLADINSDSYFDAITADQDTIRVYKNNGDTLIINKIINHGTKSGLFTGDIDSNGTSDILIDSIGLMQQIFGDQNRDGKLDVVHIKDSIGSQWLKLYRNVTPVPNARPTAPAVGFAVSTFNRTFIFWDHATDDHTLSNSITYDVRLGTSQSNIISPSFNLTNSRRMVVAHGNAGANTSMIIKGLTDNRYFYGIQSVDNAYNGSALTGGGVCPCFDLKHLDVQACKGFEVKLHAAQTATWISTSKGYLKSTDTLKFMATATDTLFAFVPQGLDCSKNRVFIVNVHDSPPVEKETIYACKGKPIKLSTEPGWQNITWDTSPPTLNVESIQFTTTRADTVHVKAKGEGCDYKKDFFIKISEPVVTINGDGFQVMRGNSVQLIASGTVGQWSWNPSESLDNSTIPNPTATPMTTTEYVVTGTDSIGCTAIARTHVVVQETAFVPNLFTPNGDGKNDNLTIYGLTSTASFKFRIYNREGSTVYETKDLSHATSIGWNGTVQGIRQPSGLYYWKVEGAMPDGSKLLLNGKSTGSILLVQ